MLLLTMNIGTERFGIDATHVIEVIPLVKLEHVPRVDHCISGIFNYRGMPVPVIDLCVFFDNRTCRNNLSSRIILIELAMPDSSQKTIGLLAERITEVIKCDSKDFNKSVINSANAQFLQYLYQRENEILQIIDVKKVIPDSISRQLSTTEH